jgi:glycosyltransferase involved in cell wall biosynthesis
MTLCTIDEPLGRCIIEALAMGCPVVVPNRAGPAELIRNKEDGLHYNPGDPKALSTALIQVLSDSALRKRLIESGFRKAAQFDIASHAAKVASVYDGLLTNTPSKSK